MACTGRVAFGKRFQCYEIRKLYMDFQKDSLRCCELSSKDTFGQKQHAGVSDKSDNNISAAACGVFSKRMVFFRHGGRDFAGALCDYDKLCDGNTEDNPE